jgi:hypothetical protein
MILTQFPAGPVVRDFEIMGDPQIPAKHLSREMADKLRELARLTRSPGIRTELVDLAKRYDRRGDHFDRRSR